MPAGCSPVGEKESLLTKTRTNQQKGTYKIRVHFLEDAGKYDKNQDYYLVIREMLDTELIEDKVHFTNQSGY